MAKFLEPVIVLPHQAKGTSSVITVKDFNGEIILDYPGVSI